MTLAIETSCDDTSVAIVEKGAHHGRAVARLHFHKKVTANNTHFHGVHPLFTLKSHQENLALLVAEAIEHLPSRQGRRRLPDFVSVTRGPGMRSNLFTGLDTAKGLAVAWQKPLVGVHHMQAHALTPRLVAALDAYNTYNTHSALDAYSTHNTHSTHSTHITHSTHNTHNTTQDAADLNAHPLVHGTAALAPTFPILSVLASGGHTMLIHSTSLTDHAILGTTDDIAVGECLDKVARVVLPAEELQSAESTMYGALLESFALPPPAHDSTQSRAKSELSGLTAQAYLEHAHLHDWYTPPTNNEVAVERSKTTWGWSINQPLTKTGGGNKIKTMGMSFSGLMTAVDRLVRYPTDPETGKLSKQVRSAKSITLDERRDMALGVMRAAFEHIASRVILALKNSSNPTPPSIAPAVVLAGGVASNAFLRHVLASTLCAHGFGDVVLYFPPPKYCTDNAAMIGWAGLEMYEAGHVDPLSIRAVRKWPLDQLLTPVDDGKMEKSNM
ncbi:N(6)-L-threonylcarbamoyladenine synthase [Ascochyta rabiei]|uniref:N(6)-L-threonylcarbamoyladenine synthase n=1 Tax=Didymella rabiei TaxID=5454 RepID=A0A162XLH8_DIDRA|nr:N(6)-L-threonylcarbamoyladenine synthase [Ascochyta rabiei]KZM19611.1 metal ion binding [Ascochyta rabiei]UPX13718.1 N(6)-L-threonylcarbamoyladenine synthase [Ascochyta rabiei]